jgi:hypothetical protein
MANLCFTSLDITTFGSFIVTKNYILNQYYLIRICLQLVLNIEDVTIQLCGQLIEELISEIHQANIHTVCHNMSFQGYEDTSIIFHKFTSTRQMDVDYCI